MKSKEDNFYTIFLFEHSEIKSNPKWTKSTELEIRNRALIGELDRLQYIEKK